MMQYMNHFCRTKNPEWGLFSIGITYLKVPLQTTFLYRLTKTEMTGQYDVKGFGWSHTSAHPACVSSTESRSLLWGWEDKGKTIKQKSTCTLHEYCGLFCVFMFPHEPQFSRYWRCTLPLFFSFLFFSFALSRSTTLKGILEITCFSKLFYVFYKLDGDLLFIKPSRKLHSCLFCCILSPTETGRPFYAVVRHVLFI